ncbi:major capsid protein [Accumulibacter sp.]|uniref:major capsid protein n=2 Tax=Accumulibacter sp. TaxID=2053492 RepID=UPI0028784CF4|nr:major capsid protein [Accumulibacter sp.]MDS4056440.1 major capsid protein [Accumulibacter sp.]HMW79194.1 major capsid protein [Accumulibacter sp.]
MPQMTPSQARVIDPVLSAVAQGYKNADLVGSALFPYVPVDQRGGKIVSFGKEDFYLYAGARAPGATTKRVVFGYSAGSYALTQFSLEGVVPWELQQESQAVPGIDQASVAVTRVLRIVALNLEKAQADLATTAGNYAASNKNTALTGTSLWSDASASDPIGDIETGREAIRAQTGRYPNTLILSAKSMKALRAHSKIIDRIKYTGRDIPTVELLASLFGVDNVLIGGAVWADASGTLSDVWGKTAVLAVTEIGSVADLGVPSYGYTYRLRGAPIVETPYEDRSAKSWVYPVTDEVQPVIAGASAGYLISPTVA